MNINVPKVLKYIGLGIIIIPFSIVVHEFGHFFAYLIFGANNVQLHAFSVSADKENLSDLQIAIASLTGPIITYLTIILAYIFIRQKYHPAWIILSLGGLIGRLVNFIYIYFRMAGYNPNPNFDEFNFSKSLGIEPLFLSIITAILFLAAYVVFLKKTWREEKFTEVSLVVLSLIIGVLGWSLIGGFILP